MSDIALIWDGQGCDLALDGTDLQLDAGLQTSIIISLFSDRRARADDLLPGDDGDRRGWWADAYPVIEGDQIGSRLWLLSREKEIAETQRRAKEYAEEALAWLVTDGIAARVEVTTSVPRRGVLGLAVAVHKLDGNIENFQYEFIWGAF
ncbi:phage GP46 family protein [Pseudomonas sp.]|uniref:phage GP46 family protein n=1 Tax=Pseudomonas sp. TaxID=306 RepID=UPI00262C2EEC|nr:phage GP46 family protein [Pseudomonas sp.]